MVYVKSIRIKNDINGNPRYNVIFFEVNDNGDIIDTTYKIGKILGLKFNKNYEIILQSYNILMDLGYKNKIGYQFKLI